MVIADIHFDEFFCKPLPAEGFEIDPAQRNLPGLIAGDSDQAELHGYEVTMEGDVIVPELMPVRPDNYSKEDR